MLNARGLDDEEDLLSEIDLARLAESEGMGVGTTGPARQPVAPLAPIDATGQEVTPLPAPPDLSGARAADADSLFRRGLELASKQAISGIALTPRPQQADLVTQPGGAEAMATRDDERRRQDALERRRGEMADRQSALRLLLGKGGDPGLEREKVELRRKEAESLDAARRRGLDLKASDFERKGQLAADKAKAAAVLAAGGRERLAEKARSKGFSDTAALRKEFASLPEVKTFKEVETAFDKIQNAATNVSAAGDLSLIFAYMKMLDPGSTVREGEFANAQNAGGVDDKLRAAYNNVTQGQRLDEAQRRDFLNQAQGLYQAQRSQFDRTAQQFSALARKQGVDPSDVLFAPASRPQSGARAKAEAAREWARKNPTDPRAAEILKRLEGK